MQNLDNISYSASRQRGSRLPSISHQSEMDMVIQQNFGGYDSQDKYQDKQMKILERKDSMGSSGNISLGFMSPLGKKKRPRMVDNLDLRRLALNKSKTFILNSCSNSK